METQPKMQQKRFCSKKQFPWKELFHVRHISKVVSLPTWISYAEAIIEQSSHKQPQIIL